jgi:DNA-binding transcriptional ArsR family regulator
MAAAIRHVAPLERRSTTEAPEDSLAVVAGAAAAGALLDPTRQRVLEHLREPGSATTVAAATGVSRQLANYHVRALERAGLIEEVGRRQRRGLTERIVRATASHYLVSPDVLGRPGAPPAEVGDRFSASYQVATAARTIREVAQLAEAARAAGRRLTTLTLDTEVRFKTPAARAAFADELLTLVTGLVARYDDPSAADGRRYRLFAGAHPVFVPKASAPAATRSLTPRAGRRRHRERTRP